MSIFANQPPQLSECTISAAAHTGYRIRMRDGQNGRLAIVDESGRIVDDSPKVGEAAWSIAQKAQENFWKGQGWIVVQTTIPARRSAA